MTLLQAPPRCVVPTAAVAWQVDESLTTFVDATAEETSAPDEPTRDRLRAAWPVVRPLSVTVAQRAAQTIRARAEDDRRP
jgi:hypothetical protein